MDDRFDEAINIVLKNEGGFSNEKEDRGGPTMHGISLRFLQENNIHILENQDISLGDILSITIKSAKEIYYKYFWIKFHINEIPNLQLATKVLDMSVNMGPITAIKILQQSINRCQLKPIEIDGIIGNKTIEALNNHNILTNRLINDYRVSLAEHYEYLINKTPSLSMFRNGWLKRASQ